MFLPFLVLGIRNCTQSEKISEEPQNDVDVLERLYDPPVEAVEAPIRRGDAQDPVGAVLQAEDADVEHGGGAAGQIRLEHDPASSGN